MFANRFVVTSQVFVAALLYTGVPLSALSELPGTFHSTVAAPPIPEENSLAVCSEWNGFLGGMLNILEHVNRRATALTISNTFFDLTATPQSTTGFTIAGGGQVDALIDTVPGWQANSYGRVCSSQANAGEFDGRMVYYKPNSSAASFDFAVAMPLQTAMAGIQYVQFNTFQPSLSPFDSANLVLNWIQLTNDSSTTRSGTLTTFDANGAEIGSFLVSLPAGTRRDFLPPGTTANIVGLVRWTPDDLNLSVFTLRMVRYYYNNPIGVDAFYGAVQLAGSKGSTETLTSPIDAFPATTVVLELTNTGDSSADVQVVVSANTGAALATLSRAVPAKGTRHLILNNVLNDAPSLAGVARIQTSGPSSAIIASAVHYARTPDGGIASSFAIQAEQPTGETLTGSFNTFLGQQCTLYLANSTNAPVATAVRSARPDGSLVFQSSETVPANGLLYLDICFTDLPNTYGAITVVPAQPNALLATVVREGNSFRFATPVR